MKSTLYLRKEGCVCYEGDFLATNKAMQELPRQFLSLDAVWWWASSRIRPLAKNASSTLPQNRLLTQLGSDNSGALTAELLERDVDGYGRSLFLFGIDVIHLQDMPSQNTLASWLRNFALHGSGPVHLVLLQPGDAKELVFVPAVPSDVARQGLDRLGVDELAPEETRKYNELRGMQLESLIHKIIAMAFGNGPHSTPAEN